MKYFLLSLLIAAIAISCSTFDEELLNGHWKNDQWEMKFTADGKCSFGKPGGPLKENLKYSTLGNSMEISENGKVILSGLTIQSVTSEELKVQFRNLVGSGDQMDNNQTLIRQK